MFSSFYLEFFKNFPAELSTFLIAMLPVAELRAAIPVALKVYDLSYFSAYFWAVLGNMIPVFFVVKYIGGVSDFLSKRFKFFDKFFNWLFKRTRKKFNHHYDKYGMLALVLFVAVPLPVTGAWTASLAAWLFDFPKKRSLFYIFIGVLVAGVAVSLASGLVIGN